MSSARQVILMTTDPATESAVVAALGSESGFELASTCRSMIELAARMELQRQSAVLVDLDGRPEQLLQELEPLIGRNPESRFVLLAESPSQSLLLEAMEIGARHVVPKQAIGTTIGQVLHRVLPNGLGRRGVRGCVVSVLSASGGCGATLLATNIANELRLLAKMPALLIDLDSYCGAVSAYLGLQPHFGLENVLIDPDRIDGDLMRSAAAIYDESLYVLQSPPAASSMVSGPLHLENLARLVEAAKSSFRFTVVDAPRLPIHTTGELAAASTVTLIPLQLTVLGIRAAKNLMTALLKSGVSGESIVPIAVRYRKRGSMIGLDEACKALERPEIPWLSNDYRSAIESVNFGKPLAASAPRSGLRQEIRELAQEIQEAYAHGRPLAIKS
jgi:pilus assembly protein CpaE